MLKKKTYTLITLILFVYTFIAIGGGFYPIEELEVINGIGYDIKKKDSDIIEYILSKSMSVYRSNGVRTSVTTSEKGKNIGEIIQKIQQKSSKKFVQGQERVILISEDYAKQSIKTLLDERFRNSEVNDMAYIAVCKGMPEEYLSYNIKGYNNAAEFIEGMVENSYNYNFSTDDYKLIDAFTRVYAEGRSLVIPYIEINKGEIKITGMAIFKKDKMIGKVDDKNSKILNFLKGKNTRGIITIEKSPLEYVEVYGKTGERKIKCNKEGDKYNINININYTCNVISNEIYKNLLSDEREKKQLEEDIKKEMEKECYSFLNTMKNQYKVDCIGLGRYLAGKFGRNKGIDWNEVVSNANIKVDIKVKLDTQGRGDY